MEYGKATFPGPARTVEQSASGRDFLSTVLRPYPLRFAVLSVPSRRRQFGPLSSSRVPQIVQYNIIRTELRKISSQLTEVVNVAKHRFLEVPALPSTPPPRCFGLFCMLPAAFAGGRLSVHVHLRSVSSCDCHRHSSIRPRDLKRERRRARRCIEEQQVAGRVARARPWSHAPPAASQSR